MNCYFGSIITLDSSNSVARYLVEEGGVIRYVGNELPEEYKNVPVTELGEKALVPSFVDTHQHLASFALFHSGLNVMEASSNKEIAQMIKAFVAKHPKTKTLIAFGASPYSVEENRLINREEIDAVCPNQEFMVVKYDGHACIINSKLLEKLGPKLSKLRGYHPDTGEMNQEAFFVVSNYISSSISLVKLIKKMQEAVDYEAERGIGEIHSVSGVGFVADADITLETLFAKSLNNGFQLRVFPQTMNLRVARRNRLPRIGGCFKCALDGCFGSADASMNEPYANNIESNGVLYYSDETVTEFCKKANRAGLQIEMHAIGDKAFDQAARCLKAALDDFPRENHRHGIIHCCLPTPEGIKICSEYKIQMPVQSAFINWKQEPDSYLEALMGKERVAKLNPIGTFVKNGISVGLGSDAPCTDPDPIVWIDKCVNNPVESERVSVQDALRMASYNGYYATFDENRRGSLEQGKTADMVVLSANPYTIPESELKNLKVEQLILGGQKYRSASRPVLRSMLSALFSRNKS